MNDKEFDYLDLITIVSFIVGLQSYDIALKNLKENEQQTEDTQNILNALNLHLKGQDDVLLEQTDYYLKKIIQQNEELLKLLKERR